MVCVNDHVFSDIGLNTSAFRKPSENLRPDQLYCISSSTGHYYNNINSSNCFNQCSVECSRIDFSFTISQTNYPTQSYKEFAKTYFETVNGNPLYNQSNFTDFENMDKTCLAINFYYQVNKI